MTTNQQAFNNVLFNPFFETTQTLWGDIVSYQHQFITESLNQSAEQVDKFINAKDPQTILEIQKDFFEQQASKLTQLTEQVSGSFKKAQQDYQQSFTVSQEKSPVADPAKATPASTKKTVAKASAAKSVTAQPATKKATPAKSKSSAPKAKVVKPKPVKAKSVTASTTKAPAIKATPNKPVAKVAPVESAKASPKVTTTPETASTKPPANKK